VKAAVFLLLGCWACLAATAALATVLLYATPYSPGHPFSRADRTWMQWVEHESHGELKIRPVWSGSLLSSDQSLIELRHHVADIGLITPIYARGGEQLIRVQAGFYAGAARFSEQTALYRCLAASSPEFAHELAGLKILAVQGGTLPGILSRTRPILQLDDVRGMRIRVPAELLGVMRDLGADPVAMPMGEVYSDLARGVLDAVVAPADALKSLHFGEVAKFYYPLKIPRGAYPARAMASDRFEALNATERDVLDRSTAVWEAALDKETAAAAAAGAEQGRIDGVKFLSVSEADQTRFNVLYNQDARRNAAELKRIGIDAMPVFNTARALAAKLVRGEPLSCPDSSSRNKSHAAT
jgi:TRAP-type C4-dicarboxylate transport system substrate-binding protein